ncbi:MAG: LemA family protein [Bacteroidales bacterium]|jgi:LemA protein|nr:LemA family protein [Bacteroidales bacterium]MDD3286192.1 LemA family protein [Bacteroidales bacterium]MDY4789811.1 LemA family protein [Bacteroidales bacterium]MEA5099746.1 LemA family protein [Bacteroidales bacterium]
MRKKPINIIVIIGIIAIIAIWVITAYNGLVKKDEACSQQWSKVESQYQRRLDLIPNLVNTVKGYASHEKETLTDVVNARNIASSSKVDPNNLTQESLDKYQQSQAALKSSLDRLMVVVERYPDLKANQNFLELQSQLEGTENRIAVERQKFADIINAFNSKLRRFPTNIIAGMFGFERKAYFAADKGAETAPKVEF